MASSAIHADLWVLEQTARLLACVEFDDRTPSRLPEAVLRQAARAVGANRHDAGLLFGARYVACRVPDARDLLERLLGRPIDGDVACRIQRTRVIGPPGIPPATADLAFLPLGLAGPSRARGLGFFPGMIDPHPPGDFRRPISLEVARQARTLLADPPPVPILRIPHGPFNLRVDPVPDALAGAALNRARAGRIFRLGLEWFLLWTSP